MTKGGSPALEICPEPAASQDDSRQLAGPPGRRRRPLLAWALSAAAHLTVFGAVLWPYAAAPPPQSEPIQVSLVEMPQPEAPPGPPGPPGPPAVAEVKPSVPQKPVRSAAPRPAAPAPVPDENSKPAPDTFADVMSETEIAGAASAGEEGAGGGGGGGGCNTARAVQQALRRDPLVHTAVEDANRLGKAIMLWDGDWVRSGAQDGKGLSAVREAIMWEVAFAPEVCRNQPVHGTVLLSLADGRTRFAIGSGDWRWADLLGVRKVASER
jgi:hypothetical protein